MTVDHILEQVSSLLKEGFMDQAASLARGRDTRGLHDAAAHLAWADVLDELGFMDEVILELNLALRDDPQRQETYARLGEVYLDQGHPLQAAHVWEALVQSQPQEPGPYQALGQALEEAKAYDKARKVYELGLEKTGDPRFPGLLKNLDFLQEPASPVDTPPPGEQFLPQPHHLVIFTNLFAGREGVYARQWVSPTGEYGYTPVPEPLTPKVAENHLLGNYTVGVYPVRLDNTVNFIAFDLDVAKFALRRAITNQRAWDAVMAKVHQAACKLVDLGAAHELPVYLEDSGFKGRHVWIFLDTPIPAGVAKKCGDLLAGLLMPLPSEVTIEVFPKQGSVPRGGLGNLIKLPLGFHKRTGRRARFIQPDGEPYGDQLAFLEQAARASRRTVYGLIQRLQSQKSQGVLATPGTGHAPASREPVTVPEPRTQLPAAQEIYNLDQDPQFQYLISRCEVLRAIAEKVNQTYTLSNEETLVLIHTLGHLEHGPEAVNEFFQRCMNADPALFLKSRLRGNPMSCPKIRVRVPHITSTVSCNCPLNLAGNLYPSPLIHLHELRSTEPVSPLGLTLESLQFQNLLQEYLKLRKQMRETQMLLERYEKRLAEFFAEAAVETVPTPMGLLRCRKKEEGGLSFTLEI